ncbi:MAG: amidohydrolase [Spirochaetales bacterium]|nr:amidohydrolase [Spirochaetales bacterium]
MPNFPIVDTHLHVWDPKNLSYPWLEDIPFLNKPYLLDGYHSARGLIDVEKMVFMQAECDPAQYREEADWVSSLAADDSSLAAIIPWAPLEDGDTARPALEALAANKLVKGIRRIIQFEPDLAFCLKPNFVKGVQLLPEYNLHFEICIAHIHLENTIKLVDRCPEVRFILDHIGKPDIKNHIMEPWKSQIGQLAKRTNVCCKISGLVTEADHDAWTRDDLKPYIDTVVESFGFDRIMFGGDWPVAFQATEYPRWVEVLEWAVGGCTEEELRKLFRENAVSFYSL